MDNFAAVVKELLALHQQQFDAAVHGDPDCTRFDLFIATANERKQEAKYAYLRQVEEHGCSRFDLELSAVTDPQPLHGNLRAPNCKVVEYNGSLSAIPRGYLVLQH